MKTKHEQLYVAVQDLLIELGIDPKKLRSIAAEPVHSTNSVDETKITPKTARKLIDADLIVEEIDWKKPGEKEKLPISGDYNLNGPDVFPTENPSLTTFNGIKEKLPPRILWSYLREEHPEYLYDEVRDYLFPRE